MVEDTSRGVPAEEEAEDVVTIAVIDTTHKLKKTYQCKRQLLLSSMKYFQTILEGQGRPTDLSIHCDISIFEWLLDYIHHPENPTLTVQDALSILISSDFLKMNALVRTCLQFITKHLNDILQLPIDVTCINDGLMDRIAEEVSSSMLCSMKLKRNKFLMRIYKHKLKLELSKTPSEMSICAHCGCPYLNRFESNLLCSHSQALAEVSSNGAIARRHSPIAKVSILLYIKLLRGLNLGWEEIYWICWASRVLIVHPPSSPDAAPVMLTALQTQHYMLHKDGVFIHRR